MSNKPHVLLITTDHWSNSLLGVSGHPTIQTLTLDALARSGTRFTRGYWGLRLGEYGVSINISPLWGCALVALRLFFCELRLCEKFREKQECFENWA